MVSVHDNRQKFGGNYFCTFSKRQMPAETSETLFFLLSNQHKIRKRVEQKSSLQFTIPLKLISKFQIDNLLRIDMSKSRFNLNKIKLLISSSEWVLLAIIKSNNVTRQQQCDTQSNGDDNSNLYLTVQL